MMRHRLALRMRGDERGFTLIELLVVMILIGILAAIALAVFLNQADKGKDADAKSNATNIAHTIQACAAGLQNADDFRDCDSEPKLTPDKSITLDPAPVDEIASGDCAGPAPSDSVADGFDARVLRAGPQCFVVMSKSGSGNVFWFIKHDDGSVSRDCRTHNQNGCPADGAWAG